MLLLLMNWAEWLVVVYRRRTDMLDKGGKGNM